MAEQLNNQRDPERRRAIIHFASEMLDLDRLQGQKGIPRLNHRLTAGERLGLRLDINGTKDYGTAWKHDNGGNRFSITYAHYLAKKNGDEVRAKLADLTAYGRQNYGLDRLYIYLLTVNPRKIGTTYGKLRTADHRIVPTVENIGQVATVQMNMENAVVYRSNNIGIGNDRHLHYAIASTIPISRRKRRDAKRQILKACRKIFGYGVTSVDFASGSDKTAGYVTKGVGLFDPLKIDKTVGQDQYGKILSAERNVNRRAGMVVLADELNESYRIHRSYFYVNPRNAMAKSWQRSRNSFKRYVENYNDPQARGRDASMDLFTIGKARKRRRRVQSKHHATTIEAVRTFNGLNRYTGKLLESNRRKIEAVNRRHCRKILANARRVMADLTNDGQKSLKSLKLAGLDQAKKPSEVLSGMVVARDTS